MFMNKELSDKFCQSLTVSGSSSAVQGCVSLTIIFFYLRALLELLFFSHLRNLRNLRLIAVFTSLL